MVRPIIMPKLGQSEEEARLVRWLKKEGDSIAIGDVLFEIETDKALLEVESFLQGTLLRILAVEGQMVPVQEIVAFVGDPGEMIPEAATFMPSGKTQERGAREELWRSDQPPPIGRTSRSSKARPTKQQAVRPEERPPVPEVLSEAPGLFRISPRAVALAKESGIASTPIVGTGPNGRIVEHDVKQYLEGKGYAQLRITPAARKLAAQENIDVLALKGLVGLDRIEVATVQRAIAERPKPMTRMRQLIAARLTQSVLSAPHFFITTTVDMTDHAQMRGELKQQGVTYTLTDFIMMAVVLSLKEFSIVNSATEGTNIRWHSKVHLGLAVNIDQGLVVPVIRDADDLTLAEIHDRASELIAKARAGKLIPEEMTGSTFTISNMGMLNVENFTAIINPGESAILAVSSISKQPVVKANQIVIRDTMKMTLSSDHRIIDGAMAAAFLNSIKNRLEETSLWKRLA